MSDEIAKSPAGSPILIGMVHLVSKDRLPSSDLNGLPFERWEGNVSQKFITYAQQIPQAGTMAVLVRPSLNELGVVDTALSKIIKVDIKVVQTNNLELNQLHEGDNMQQHHFHMLAVEI